MTPLSSMSSWKDTPLDLINKIDDPIRRLAYDTCNRKKRHDSFVRAEQALAELRRTIGRKRSKRIGIYTCPVVDLGGIHYHLGTNKR